MYLRFILNKIVLQHVYATVAKILIKNSWNFTWISSSPIAKLSLMCQRKAPVNHSLVTKCLELQRQELRILTFEIFSLKTFHNYRSRTSIILLCLRGKFYEKDCKFPNRLNFPTLVSQIEMIYTSYSTAEWKWDL